MKRIVAQYCTDDVLTKPQQTYMTAVKAETVYRMPGTTAVKVARKPIIIEEPLVKGAGVKTNGAAKLPPVEIGKVEKLVMDNIDVTSIARTDREREVALMDSIVSDDFDINNFTAINSPYILLGVWAWDGVNAMVREYSKGDVKLILPHNFAGWPDVV
jgi:hypothetical protein